MQGERFDVQHACPQCPSPLATGIAIAPSIFCRWCSGTGLVTTAQLAAWQRAANAGELVPTAPGAA